jgi:hypothetical protein
MPVWHFKSRCLASQIVATSAAKGGKSSQAVTSSLSNTALTSQIVMSNMRGGRRTLPYAFTEQGVAMQSGVLR